VRGRHTSEVRISTGIGFSSGSGSGAFDGAVRCESVSNFVTLLLKGIVSLNMILVNDSIFQWNERANIVVQSKGIVGYGLGGLRSRAIPRLLSGSDPALDVDNGLRKR